MLSVSQITPYLSEENPKRRLKPWWENFNDFLTHSLLVIVMLSWNFLLQDYSSGVNCILQDANKPQLWNTIYAKYYSQKCAFQVFEGCLVYFPYYVFVQWMLFLFCQMLWLKLPQVNSKLNVMYQICEKLNQAEKAILESKQIKSELFSNSEALTRKTIEDYVRIKLYYFISEDSPAISTIYGCKNLLTLFIASTFLGLMFCHFPNWMDLWRKQNVSCLNSGRPFNGLQMFCNLGCGRFTFVLICLNSCVLVSFITVSVIGYAFWIYKRQCIKKLTHEKLFAKWGIQSGLKDFYSALCFIDLNKQYGRQLVKRLIHLLITLNNGDGTNEELRETHI